MVPTDYSENSKTGILFAIQWAKQQQIQTCFYSYYADIAYSPGGFKKVDIS